MKIKDTPLDKIIPYARNPRVHGAAIEKVAASIKEFRFRQPIVVDAEGVIIAGHARYEAARRLGLEKAPVHVADDLTPAQAKAYRLADNRVAQEAEWDDALLGLEFEDLKLMDFDLGLTGFGDDELAALGSERQGLTGDDEIPPVEEDRPPVTQPGDLWILGAHRLLCGDSTLEKDVKSVMNGECAACVLTDPPYGLNQPGVPHDEPDGLSELVAGAVACLPCENSIVVAFQSTRTFPLWLDAVRAQGHEFQRMLWLYKEAQCTFPWRGWILTSESILVSTIGRASWKEIKPYAHDCYKISEVSGELDPHIGWHGAVKPNAILQDILQRTSSAEDCCYDGFLGSGSTLIAAEKTQRRCYGLEISPVYCDVILRRWQDYTGQAAVLEGDGTFAAVSGAREAA